MGATTKGNTYKRTSRCLTNTTQGSVEVKACISKKNRQQWRLKAGTLSTKHGTTCLLATATPGVGSSQDRRADDWSLTGSRQLREGTQCLSQDDFVLPKPRLRLRACDTTSPDQRWYVGKRVNASAASS